MTLAYISTSCGFLAGFRARKTLKAPIMPKNLTMDSPIETNESRLRGYFLRLTGEEVDADKAFKEFYEYTAGWINDYYLNLVDNDQVIALDLTIRFFEKIWASRLLALGFERPVGYFYRCVINEYVSFIAGRKAVPKMDTSTILLPDYTRFSKMILEYADSLPSHLKRFYHSCFVKRKSVEEIAIEEQLEVEEVKRIIVNIQALLRGQVTRSIPAILK